VGCCHSLRANSRRGCATSKLQFLAGARAPCSCGDRSRQADLYPEFLPGSIPKSDFRTRLDDFTPQCKLNRMYAYSICALRCKRLSRLPRCTTAPIHTGVPGVYAAYREILPRSKRNTPLCAASIHRTFAGRRLQGWRPCENAGTWEVWKNFRRSPASSLVWDQMPEGDVHVRDQSGGLSPRYVRDSFLWFLVDYLAPHFDETVRRGLLDEARVDRTVSSRYCVVRMVERKLNVPITDPRRTINAPHYVSLGARTPHGDKRLSARSTVSTRTILCSPVFP